MKQIKLENFRCYADLAVNFKSGINLLVGDNASGKTSIIKACRYVLSSFFAGFSDENTKWINKFGKDDFREVSIYGEIQPLKPIEIQFIPHGNLFSYDIETKYLKNQTTPNRTVEYITPQQRLFQNTTKNGKIILAGIKGYRQEAQELSRTYRQEAQELSRTYFNDDKRVKPLPLFAYFAAKDYENVNAQAKKKFKQYFHIPSFGYFECLDVKSNFSNWIFRLMVLQEGKENLQDIDIVRSAIVDVLSIDGCNIITDMDVRDKQNDVFFTFTDGRNVASKNLSDGYKRVLNIVIDLAFRCVHLNRSMYNECCCKETKGTVLIDEIDLHLHPTLQSTILKGLRNAFPNLQFIVTTHAPMVMSSVESNDENVVYRLDYSNEEGYSVNEVVTYGMDLSTISEFILEQSPRNPEVDIRLTKLHDLIDNEEYEEARSQLERYKAGRKISTPDATEIEAILNCEIIDDTNEED